jgi:hypothetical protein
MDKMTKGEKTAIEAIEKSISKVPFDTGIRALYLANTDVYSKGNQGGLIGSFRQYSTNDLNGFKPDKTTSFDYPWQDIFGTKLKKKKQKLLKGYQRRGFFKPMFDSSDFGKEFILSAEELVTIYHFARLTLLLIFLSDHVPKNRSRAHICRVRAFYSTVCARLIPVRFYSTASLPCSRNISCAYIGQAPGSTYRTLIIRTPHDHLSSRERRGACARRLSLRQESEHIQSSLPHHFRRFPDGTKEDHRS